jgi:hypothetical protein
MVVPLPAGNANSNLTHTMSLTESPARQFDAAYFAAQALQTRSYGHVYVHVGAPAEFQHGDITFSVTGYGRSLQSGGHKYKVHATRNGKPVSSTELRTLR